MAKYIILYKLRIWTYCVYQVYVDKKMDCLVMEKVEKL